jgi:hypothetical protein
MKKEPTLDFAIEKPIKEIIQYNGKSWRKYTLFQTHLSLESSSKHRLESKTLPFHRIGFRKPDFVQFTTVQPWHNAGVRILVLYLMMALSIVPFAIADSATANDSPVFKTIFNILGVIILSLTFVVLIYMIRGKRVVQRKFYFNSGGFITMYYRTPQEVDQVDDFIKTIDKTLLVTAKKNFLESFERSPAGLGDWLKNLYEKDVFDHSEFADLMKAIDKADAKLKKEHENSGH